MSDEKNWILTWNEGAAAWAEPVDEKVMSEGYSGEYTWDSSKAACYTRQQVEIVMNLMQHNGHGCYAYTLDGFDCDKR